MKNTITYKFYLLTLCLAIGTIVGYGQSESLNWTGECYLVTINEVNAEISSSLTKQGSTFTWVQQGSNTSDTEIFSIVSTSGNWDNQAKLGELNYNLILAELTGFLSVTVTNEGVLITLRINGQNGNDHYNYVFTMDTFTIL